MCVCVRECVEGENAADNNGKRLFPASRPGKGFMSDASFAKRLGEFFFFFFQEWRASLIKNILAS